MNKKNKLQQKIDKKNVLIKYNTTEIQQLEEEVKLMKQDIEITKNEQIFHYRQILKRGQDCRKDGLIWVIKVLWNLNQDIIIDDMPEFLDSKAIKFLLEYAKYDIKRHEIHQVLKEVRQKLKKNKLHNVVKQKMSQMSPDVRN